MSALDVRAETLGPPPVQLRNQVDLGEDGLHLARYSVAFCPKCESAFLHATATSEPSDIPYEVMLYPSSNRRSIPGLPEPVHRTFESAQSCFETGNFEPCVIMCRKCVEALCAFHGVPKGKLVDRLKALRDSGRIETRLYEWADELRLVGNDAAHDLTIRISKQDAVDSLNFVEAILLYVFSLDQRFRDFQTRRQEAKEAKAKQPSNP